MRLSKKNKSISELQIRIVKFLMYLGQKTYLGRGQLRKQLIVLINYIIGYGSLKESRFICNVNNVPFNFYNDKHKTPQSHIPVAKGAAIVPNTGKAGAGEKYFRRWDRDGIGEFAIFGACWICDFPFSAFIGYPCTRDRGDIFGDRMWMKSMDSISP